MPLSFHSPWGARPVLLALVAAAGSAATQVSVAAGAEVPTQLQYTSVINGYKPYADEPVQSWRESNDRAGSIGGWKTYAKEIKGGTSGTNAPATPSSDSAAGHHSGAKQ